MRTRAELEAALYDGLVSFNATAAWDILRFAQHRQYLAEHLAAALDTEEKATDPASATATPGEPTGRVAALLNEIRRQRGTWTVTRAIRFYRNSGRVHTGYMTTPRLRAVARGDLRDLHTWGHLDHHDEPGKQYFTLTKGGRS